MHAARDTITHESKKFGSSEDRQLNVFTSSARMISTSMNTLGFSCEGHSRSDGNERIRGNCENDMFLSSPSNNVYIGSVSRGSLVGRSWAKYR